ncbi:MAG: hypothetical protein NVV59_01865 [Chitinophagaceae bacterium]|nr:hypothetical protein [Chitinophagaceae bacterium]
MERIQALINQLKELSDNNADSPSLLAVVQQLQQELMRQQQPRSLGTSKVAVLMPANVVSQELVAQYGPKVEEPVVEEPAVEVAEETPTVKDDGRLEMRFDPMVEIPTLSQQVQMKTEVTAAEIPSF